MAFFQNDLWVERVIRELKEDFLAWLTGQVFPERPLLARVSRRLLARVEGRETLVPVPVPVPVPVAGVGRVARAGETVEVRPLSVYAELVR